MKTKTFVLFVAMITLILALSACAPSEEEITLRIENAVLKAELANQPAPAADAQPDTAAASIVDLDTEATGGDPNVWNQPQTEGVMTVDSKIVYTQSGKQGEQIITGTINESDNLVVTAYRFTQAGEVFDQGVVIVIEGPYDLTKNPIDIVDGAATLVSKDATQAKLNGMYVDFCRGDKTEDGAKWSYKRWALAHVSVGNYAFPDLSTCFNAAGDTYPNNPPQP